MSDLHLAHIDPASIRSLACSDALLGMINAIDLPLRSTFRQLTERPASATTHIENCVVLLDGNVLQAPVGHLRMSRIHVPQNESTQPSCWLLTLIYASTVGDHVCFHSGSLRCCPLTAVVCDHSDDFSVLAELHELGCPCAFLILVADDDTG